MLLFESFERRNHLLYLLSSHMPFYIIFDNKKDCELFENLLIKNLGYVYNDLISPISDFNLNSPDESFCLFINVVIKEITYRQYENDIVERNKRLFFYWNSDKEYILDCFGLSDWNRPNYKPKQIIYENETTPRISLKLLKDIKIKKETIFITVNDRTSALNLIKILKLSQLTSNITKIGDLLNFDYNSNDNMVLFYIFYNSDIPHYDYLLILKSKFESSNVHSNVISYPTDTLVLQQFLNIIPMYKPKQMVYESNNPKILYSFDMDNTLVYSKRFEEYVKPLLINEYLTPEMIFNNKLEDVGVDLELLKYENGRIYFDDPHQEYGIPKGSSWVRKKSRIYLIQPDEFFMTDESMPTGTYDEIVNLYNNSENKCIITARNERLRQQTLNKLNKLGIEKPNFGLFMYPINSFSYIHEYKANKLLSLYKSNDFDEIHYFDDNIKLLKKIKQNLQGKNINIKYFKVTKNEYRQI